MFYKNKFIYGTPDLTNDIDFMEINECGAYNFLSYNKIKIKISNDYNSLSRIYYFQNENLFISTNNYHLLLKFLSFCNVVKKINEEQLKLMLTFNNTQFRQPITENFIIKNTYCLKPFQEIIIDKSNIKKINKKSINVFYDNATFDKNLYENLVKKITQDIICNLKSVLNNRKFKHIICELSGGKDSRTNYAAFTNIKDAEKKVKLHTMAEDRDVNDFKVAMSIANIYDFEYYYGSFKTYINFDSDFKTYFKRQRSIYMCNKWLWSPKINHNGDHNIIAINGECAESFYVRYYSKLLKLTIDNLQSLTKDDILKEYISLLNRNCILPTNENYKLIYINLLNVLNTSPGNIPLERFDNLFNHYRGSTQIGGSERDYFGFASCMPIQSKYFWKAKKLALNNFVEEKLIFDLLRELNPVLCEINFGSNTLNKHREIMKKKSIWTEEQINNIKIPEYNYDDTKWRSKQNLKTFYVNDLNNFSNSTINIDNIIHDNLIYNLKRLYTIDNGNFEDIVIKIMYNLKINKNDKINTLLLHNKITTIIDSYDSVKNNVILKKKSLNICFMGVSTSVDKKGFRVELLNKLKKKFNIKEIKGYIGGFSPISLLCFAKNICNVFNHKIDVMILDMSILVPPFSIMYDEFRDMYFNIINNFFQYINQKNILCFNVHNYVHRDISHFYGSYYNEFPSIKLIGEKNTNHLLKCINENKATNDLNPTLYFFKKLEDIYPNIIPIYICKYIDKLLTQKKYILKDLYKDNIHPNEKGSKIIANRIFEYMEKYNYLPIKIHNQSISNELTSPYLITLNNNNNYINNLINVNYCVIKKTHIFNTNKNLYSIILLMDKNNCYFKINDIEYSSFNKEIVTLLCNKKETTKYVIELKFDKLIVDNNIRIDVCLDKEVIYQNIDYCKNNTLLDYYDVDLNTVTKNNCKELKVIGFVGI